MSSSRSGLAQKGRRRAWASCCRIPFFCFICLHMIRFYFKFGTCTSLWLWYTHVETDVETEEVEVETKDFEVETKEVLIKTNIETEEVEARPVSRPMLRLMSDWDWWSQDRRVRNRDQKDRSRDRCRDQRGQSWDSYSSSCCDDCHELPLSNENFITTQWFKTENTVGKEVMKDLGCF